MRSQPLRADRFAPADRLPKDSNPANCCRSTVIRDINTTTIISRVGSQGIHDFHKYVGELRLVEESFASDPRGISSVARQRASHRSGGFGECRFERSLGPRIVEQGRGGDDRSRCRSFGRLAFSSRLGGRPNPARTPARRPERADGLDQPDLRRHPNPREFRRRHRRGVPRPLKRIRPLEYRPILRRSISSDSSI